jgi:CheY-like chemotaxis protein
MAVRDLSLPELASVFLDLATSTANVQARGLRVRRDSGAFPFVETRGFSDAFQCAQDCCSELLSKGWNMRCVCGAAIGRGNARHAAEIVWTGEDAAAFFDRCCDHDGLRTPCLELGFGTVAAIPLCWADQCLGVLHLADPRPNCLGTEQLECLRKMAAVFGAALDGLGVGKTSSPHRLRALVVDDDELFRRTIHDLLASQGVVCTAVTDALSALETVESIRFDVVVTDLEMPVMSGTGLARELRGRYGFYGPAVVVLTGDPGKVSDETRRQYGIGAVVAKPITDVVGFAGLLARQATAAADRGC